MRKSNILILILFISVRVAAFAHNPDVDNYHLLFSRNSDEAYNFHIECSFIANSDSLNLNFGGGNEFSVSDLTVSSDNLRSYNYNMNDQVLSIVLKSKDKCRVTVSYEYTNITSALLYKDYGCEFWETSFREYYYPFIFGERCNFSITFDIPHNISVKGAYSTAEESKKYVYTTTYPIISHSCIFALLDKNKYITDEFSFENYGVETFYKPGSVVPSVRKEELAEITEASIRYFSEKFGPYEDSIAQINTKPIYIFHGNGYSNRNNLNIISASFDKFISKPNIFPLVHEIGHRWLGEWTLLIPDGEPGAYFMKESLNEYMTLLFIKHYYGEAYFEKYFNDNYIQPYLAVKGHSNDARLIDMTFNANNIVVYCKGPVLIHSLVKEWGEENWLDFMKTFYMRYKYTPDLSYDMFISAMAEKSLQHARKLDLLVREL